MPALLRNRFLAFYLWQGVALFPDDFGMRTCVSPTMLFPRYPLSQIATLGHCPRSSDDWLITSISVLLSWMFSWWLTAATIIPLFFVTAIDALAPNSYFLWALPWIHAIQLKSGIFFRFRSHQSFSGKEQGLLDGKGTAIRQISLHKNIGSIHFLPIFLQLTRQIDYATASV